MVVRLGNRGAIALNDSSSASQRLTLLQSVSAVAFALGFSVFFYTRTLYNSAPLPENRISRLDLLIWMSLTDGNNPFVDLMQRLTSVENLPQRLPIVVLAVAILAAAVAAGDLILAALRLQPASRCQRLLYAYALGMGAVSLAVLLLGLAELLHVWSTAGVGALVGGAWWAKRRRTPKDDPPAEAESPSTPWLLILAGPFLMFALLAAMIPTPDYDALAYHLLGPKEWFLQGRIQFLPHNVYTTFPFLTEMFSLLGMAASGDWFLGGLVGQTVLWSFGPAGGLALYVLGDRLFGRQAGWTAALIYLTTPWIYRLSSIPYVEGALLFYTVVAVDASLRIAQSPRWGAVAGALAGCAFCCKYTGAVTTLAPVAVILLFDAWKRRRWSAVVWAGVGVAVVAGPWLVRNAVWTGNPVYPLAANVFPSPYWSAEQAEKFRDAHDAEVFDWPSVQRYLMEIPATSDWQSALVFAFAPLALLGARPRAAGWLWLLVLYLFIVFWGLTHRLDRFWLPLEPFAAILAGAGVAWLASGVGKVVCWSLVGLALVYNLAYCTVGLCGVHTYLADLNGQRASRVLSEPSLVLSSDPRFVSPNSKVLFVGYAAVYYADRPVLYNTVFDKNVLLDMVWDEESGQVRSDDEIQDVFRKAGVDYILVDWNWIKHYRSPGNYGFPAEINEELFETLQKRRWIRETPASSVYPGLRLYAVTKEGGR